MEYVCFSKAQKLYYILGVLLLLLSCNKKYMSREELQAYAADSSKRLYQWREAGDVRVEVLFRPASLLHARKAGNSPASKNKNSMYDSCYYFVVNISKSGQELEVFYVKAGIDFSAAMEELSFNMRDYLLIITEKRDTLYPIDVVYSRMYGSTGHSSFMLAFKKSEFASLSQFEFLIKELGLGAGSSSFTFMTSDLENVPEIKF
jgi:hypothetical protein